MQIFTEFSNINTIYEQWEPGFDGVLIESEPLRIVEGLETKEHSIGCGSEGK